MVDAFLDINKKNSKDSTRQQVANPESVAQNYVSNASSFGTIVYPPSEFPEARTGSHLILICIMLISVLQKIISFSFQFSSLFVCFNT